MHLRRALLLFAVVLGVTALVTSLNPPRESPEPRSEQDTTRPATPRATAGRPRNRPARLAFVAGKRPRTSRLEARRPATILVEVEVAGQAELQGLGLIAPAAPATPARFELLADEPGTYPVVFIPAASGVRTRAGTLIVTRPRGAARRRG